MKKTNGFLILLISLLVFAILGGGCWLWYTFAMDHSGWEAAGSSRRYLDEKGRPVTGWQEIDGSRYYFDSDGTMATGLLKLDGNLYFLGRDGILATGWQKLGDQTYYFDESGSAANGWLELEGKRYYLCDGILTTGWREIEGSRYYFQADGAMATGSITLEGQTYAFREDGSLSAGWQDGRYYLADGSAATGWQEIDGKRYCFREDGSPHTGWLEEGEYRYYLLEDGSAAVGPLEIDGYTYHFTPKGVQLWLVNSTHLVPEFYEVEKQLVTGGVYVDKLCAGAFEKMLTDCQSAGNAPHAKVGYRSYWDQQWIYNDTMVQVGQGGLLYVAKPNASEHQLGLAVDVTDSNVPGLNIDQERTGTYKWMQEHCWEYGFILRYPNGTTAITGVGYEPWHYRYVGVEVAMEMKELGITLEEYLGAA